MAFEIQYFGHSTALITLSTGKKIIVDPFLEGNPSCPKELYNPVVDVICLTHGHGDHTGSAVALAKETKAKVLGPYELLVLLQADGIPEDQIVQINKGGTTTVDGTRFTLTHAFHSSSYTTSSGKTEYAGEPSGLVIRTSDGDSLYHAGDTAIFGDMKLIGEIYKPRVALVPIGDTYTMGPEEAAIAVKMIRPKFAIPIHWGTFPPLTGTPEQFQKALAGSETEVITMKPGETRKL